MKYRPQLDALRGIAVLLMLIHHLWVPEVPVGPVGLRIFFVLSGFLVTRLLLDRPPLGQFFLRRATRLLPAFYVCLAAAFLLDLPGMRETWAWHLFNASNILFAHRDSWEPAWPSNHLWSLNVEEQFYLVWPLLLLFAPRRLVGVVLLACLIVGPAFRIGMGEIAGVVLPFGSVDALAAGALLAFYRGPAKPIYIAGLICSPFLLRGLVAGGPFVDMAGLPAIVALVLAGSRDELKPLSHPSIVGLGRISYGVYLYHAFVWAALFWVPGLGKAGTLTFVVVSALTIGLSWLSFTYFEQPARKRLEKRFGLGKRPIPAAPAAGVSA